MVDVVSEGRAARSERALKLDGKVALVTGAGSGIGRAIAHAFAEEGARVALTDIDARMLEDAVHGAPGSPQDIVAIAADATRSEDAARAVEQVLGRWGRIDILANNVGGAIGGVGLDVSEEDWEATLALTLKSQFLHCRAVAPAMRAQRRGRIINISSNAGKYRSNTGMSSLAYATAKGGVQQLTRSVAHELGRFGITVNAIAPGSVLSEAGVREFEALPEDLRERVMRETPLGYFADPREIASVAVFLASDDASYVTGATILPSGGWCTS